MMKFARSAEAAQEWFDMIRYLSAWCHYINWVQNNLTVVSPKQEAHVFIGRFALNCDTFHNLLFWLAKEAE